MTKNEIINKLIQAKLEIVRAEDNLKILAEKHISNLQKYKLNEIIVNPNGQTVKIKSAQIIEVNQYDSGVKVKYITNLIKQDGSEGRTVLNLFEDIYLDYEP